MIGGLIPIAGGVLASSGFIISKKPNAKELIDKLVPYQGWIGAVMFFWGIWETISVVTHLGELGTAPLRFVFWMLVASTLRYSRYELELPGALSSELPPGSLLP